MLKRLAMSTYKFIDIGVNLTDPVYRGVYFDKQCHQDDLSDVLKRAKDNGVVKQIVTAGHMPDVAPALELCKTDESLFCTVGCHPTRCNDFVKNPDGYYNELLHVATENREQIVAIGECGLDYDREHFCKRDVQMKYFEKQFDLASETQLPMFLHMRNACADFVDIYKRNRDCITGGVAHCFTGTLEEARTLIDLGLYIGITGCSLKTQENLDVVKELPIDCLMLETDAPWCEIKNTHAGSKLVKTKLAVKKKERWESGCGVKSRNEPCNIVQVLEVVAGVRNEDPLELAAAIFANTEKLFFNKNG